MVISSYVRAVAICVLAAMSWPVPPAGAQGGIRNPDPRRAIGVLSDLDSLERALAAAVADGSRDAYGVRIRSTSTATTSRARLSAGTRRALQAIVDGLDPFRLRLPDPRIGARDWTPPASPAHDWKHLRGLTSSYGLARRVEAIANGQAIAPTGGIWSASAALAHRLSEEHRQLVADIANVRGQFLAIAPPAIVIRPAAAPTVTDLLGVASGR